jgi:hypothetical protein
LPVPTRNDTVSKEGSELVYRCAKQHSEATSDKRGAKIDALTLTPLELNDRIAALVPHRARTNIDTLVCWHPIRR